jgi:opacity protein-like surface antigen
MLCLSGLVILSGMAVAGEAETNNQVFSKSHQLGVRLGGWANRGSSPADSIPGEQPAEYFLTEIGDANFYLEGFFGYRFNSVLMGELSVGVVSRGDVTFVESDGGSSFGTLVVYPVLAKLKLYPFGSLSGKFHPYLFAGGGIYYGKHDIQIVSGFSSYLRQQFGETSKTTFDYLIGGGLDWPLASIVALGFQVQYMPIGFSGELVGVRDYSSLTITVGAKYLFRSKKK